MLSIQCYGQPFFKSYNLRPILQINFPYLFDNCSMPIYIVFFLSFFIWGSHNRFVKIKYMIGDPLGGMLFVLIHLCAFRLTALTNPPCVFLLLAHIVRLHQMWFLFSYDYNRNFQHQGFYCSQRTMYFGLHKGWTTLYHFLLVFLLLTLYLGTLIGSQSFIESFMVEALHEDLGIIYNIFMLANL